MPNVELLFGPMLIGTYINTILYGILVLQAFIYYQSYKRDATWIRYLVLYLFICETLNMGFDVGMMYEPLVERYGSVRATTIFPVMLCADPMMTVLISTPVHVFISWRIMILSESRIVPGIVCFLAFCALAGGIATTIACAFVDQFAKIHQMNPAVITWLASSAAADICITASLVWSLHKRKTGHSKTDDMINRLIRLTVQTGAITAVTATVDLVLFVSTPKTTLNFFFDFSLSKLYTNSLLSTFNARAGWNNLAGNPQNRDNVLFGEPTSDPTTKRNAAGGSTENHSVSTIEFRVRSNPTTTTHMSSHHIDDSKRDLESAISAIRAAEHCDEMSPATKE